MGYSVTDGVVLDRGQLRREEILKLTHLPVPFDMNKENDFVYELTKNSFERKGKEMDNTKIQLNGLASEKRMKHLNHVVVSKRSARGVLGKRASLAVV